MLTDNPSGCSHEADNGEPCSKCVPPKSWVEQGLVPSEWKHVPWDVIEMKHGKLKEMVREDDDNDRYPSIRDVSQRSVRFGSEDERSVEAEKWPLVKITKHETMSDQQVPPPTDNTEGEGSSSSPRASGRSEKSKYARGRQKRSKSALTISETVRRSMPKLSERRHWRKKVVIPSRKGKRIVKVSVNVSVQVNPPRSKSAANVDRMEKNE